MDNVLTLLIGLIKQTYYSIRNRPNVTCDFGYWAEGARWYIDYLPLGTDDSIEGITIELNLSL